MLEQVLWMQRKPSMSSVTHTSILEIILLLCNRIEVIGLDTPLVAGQMAIIGNHMHANCVGEIHVPWLLKKGPVGRWHQHLPMMFKMF